MTKANRTQQLTILILMTTALLGCGGGGAGDSSSSPQLPPPTQTVNIENTITGVIEKGGINQEGVTVELINNRSSDPEPLSTTTTDATGVFLFNVPDSPTHYSVRVHN